MPVKLLIRPLPLPGEGALGYAARLAIVNSICSLRRLLGRFGLSLGEAMNMGAEALWRIASGELEVLELADRAHARPTGTSRPWLYCYATRCCPRCLQDAEFWRAEWDWPLALACRVHRQLLVDTCQACQRPIVYCIDRPLFRCVCGHRHCDSKAKPAPTWLPAFESVFRPWTTDPAFSPLDASALLEERRAATLLNRLLMIENDANGGLPSKKGAQARTFIRVGDSGRIGRLVDDWPASLARTLAVGLGRMTVRQRAKVAAQIRTVKLPLLAAAMTDVFGRIRSVSRPYVVLCCDEPPPAGHVLIRVLVEASGINGNHVYELFRSGQLAGSALSLARRWAWVAEEELQLALALRRDAPILAEAADFVNCSPKFLSALQANGFLCAVVEPRSPAYLRIRISDLIELLKRLNDRAREIGQDRNSYVPLAKLVPRDPLAAPAWVRLLNKIRRRETPLFHLGRPELGLANFAVRKADARHFQARRLARIQLEPAKHQASVGA